MGVQEVVVLLVGARGELHVGVGLGALIGGRGGTRA